MLANLGFIPPDLNFPALEITPRAKLAELLKQFPELAGYTPIVDGDAHRLSKISTKTAFTLSEPTIADLRLACAGREGKGVEIIEGCHDRNVVATVNES